jgi:hypothetical protein
MSGIGPFGGGGWWDPVKLAANNGDGEILQLLADAGARLVDHDAALYLYRAYAVMGREVKLHRKGQTETYQSHDDAFYHPDIFTVGAPFQLPDGTPPCVLKLIHADKTGCRIPVTGDRDTTAPVAFFGTRPADGSIASFEAKGEGKPDEDSYGYGADRAEHLSLGGWRVHGYTLVLEELLHRCWRSYYTKERSVLMRLPNFCPVSSKLRPEWVSWRLLGSCFGGARYRQRVFRTSSKRFRTPTGRFPTASVSNASS